MKRLRNRLQSDREDGGSGYPLDLPFDEAIAYFRHESLHPDAKLADVWDAAHSKMFMVAGAIRVALVDDFRASIEKATRTTLEEFHGLRPDRKRTAGPTRANSAARERSSNQSCDRLCRRPLCPDDRADTLATLLAISPFRRTSSAPQHKAWDEKIYPADDPFWVTAYPPNGFRCGCHHSDFSGAVEAPGQNGPDRAPDLDQLGTDQPLSVDPSFAYNPSMAWLKQTAPGPKAVSATRPMLPPLSGRR
ncbi:phage head morphogenesis protein [Rhizobium sp. SL86]|uniref:phage head morphogenesis protein n=1 Tax=Rhizobium sp. SL86 TaxID=2995148 RepID=UPI00227381AD|nr:hypothetical protein [Rhizobium sp. SL86]MCY1666253.1 hypothetical protein [Rhizobium sp. SL86]